MLKKICLLYMCSNLAAADCDHCCNGHFQEDQGWLCPVGPTNHKKNDACHCAEGHPQDAAGIFCPTPAKCQEWDGPVWVPGKGDIIYDGADYCDTMNANVSVSNGNGYKGPVSFHFASHIAKVLSNGKLEGMHRQHKLGRPGRCAADAYVRLHGEPMKQVDGTPAVFKVGSVGKCCDKCLETEGCVGWNMDDVHGHGVCSLLSSLSGTWESQSCSFSGVHVQQVGTNPTHYGDPKTGCESDEQAVQVQGVSGDFCSPKCKSQVCPTDVPSGVTAKPQCALQTPTGTAYCALICTPSELRFNGANGECGAASCQAIQGTGLCTYPTSEPRTILVMPAQETQLMI